MSTGNAREKASASKLQMQGECNANATLSQKASAMQDVSGTHVPSQRVCFYCPECTASELSSNAIFQIEDLDRKCKCSNCKRSSKVNNWMCACRRKWHLCAHHQVYANCNKKKLSCSSGPAPAKRLVGPLSLEQLQEFGVKRIHNSKSSFQPLPPNRNILSAKLRERFAHLL